MEEILKNKLIDLANQKTAEETEDAIHDDPYERGVEDGHVLLAREILKTFCIKY